MKEREKRREERQEVEEKQRGRDREKETGETEKQSESERWKSLRVIREQKKRVGMRKDCSLVRERVRVKGASIAVLAAHRRD